MRYRGLLQGVEGLDRAVQNFSDNLVVVRSWGRTVLSCLDRVQRKTGEVVIFEIEEVEVDRVRHPQFVSSDSAVSDGHTVSEEKEGSGR